MPTATAAADTAADVRPAALPLRDDTFLGVCQAIGDDFGFSPDWLRVLFGAGVLYSPLAAIAAYCALGVVVALSRIIAPNQRIAPAPPQLVAEPAAEAPATAAAAAADQRVPLAA
jgi:phage shock protein C